MYIQPATPQQLKEAVRLSRSRFYLVPFLVRCWYSLFVLGGLVVVAVRALIDGSDPNWMRMGIVGGVSLTFTVIKWFRWKAALTEAESFGDRRSGSLTLDSDGIRKREGGALFAFWPWSGYTKLAEGRDVFMLTGPGISTLIPVSDLDRETVRGMLQSNIH